MADYNNIYPSLELQDSSDNRDRDSQGDTHPVLVTNADNSDNRDKDSRGDTHPVQVTNAAAFKSKRLYPDLSGLMLMEGLCPAAREQEINTGICQIVSRHEIAADVELRKVRFQSEDTRFKQKLQKLQPGSKAEMEILFLGFSLL